MILELGFGPGVQTVSVPDENILGILTPNAVTVDLTGLGAGSHSCELRFPVEGYPGVSFEPETPAISIVLTEAKAE